jgi:amidase
MFGALGVTGLAGLAGLAGSITPPVLAQTIPRAQVGPVESHVLDLKARFDLLEPTRRAWISTNWDAALRTAQEQDRRPPPASTETSILSVPSILHNPAREPLFGMVIGVKDNIDVDGFVTTAGSKSLRENRPKSEATVVSRLRGRGVIIAGKTNLDTFARGVRSVSEVRGQTANAWDDDRAAGGSSGGSAVAVASGMVDAALGTDTCGSLRYPATYNGIYSLRPTWGLLSRHGIVPLSPSQDTVGPIARTPMILRLMFRAMLGPDTLDPATKMTAALEEAKPRLKPYRIGILNGFGTFGRDANGRVKLGVLSNNDVEVVSVSLPKGVSNASLIASEGNASIASFRTWLTQQKDTTTNSAPWLSPSWKPVSSQWRAAKNQQRRNAVLITELLDLERLDALAYPTTPFAVAALGAPQPSANCWLSATSGLPALAIPGGFNDNGFPLVGVDLLGRNFSELMLLDIAEANQ